MKNRRIDYVGTFPTNRGDFMRFYIPQISYSDCGFACLKMLIAHLYQNENALYIQQDESKGAYSFKSLIDTALMYGIKLEGIEISEKNEIKNGKFPFIALLQTSEESFHYVLVTKYRLGTVYYADPDEGECTLSLRSFNRLWVGTALIVDEFEKKDIYFNVYLPKEKHRGVVQTIMQVITALLLGTGIYFLDDKTNIYIPIIFLSLAFISEVVLRTLLLKRMQKMDESYLSKVSVEKKRFYTFYERYEDYKKVTITGGLNLVFSIILIIFMAVIVLLNNIYNAFIVLIPLLIAIFDSKYITMELDKKKKEIAKQERELSVCKNVDLSKNILNQIHLLTYKLGRMILLKKCSFILILVLVSLLTSTINETFSLPYVVFYFAIGYMLLEQYLNFLNYPNIRKEELKAKVKLNNSVDNR